jgi:hypothetical protein
MESDFIPVAPPPTPEMRLQRAIQILNELDAEYDIKVMGTQYIRTIKYRTKDHAKD